MGGRCVGSFETGHCCLLASALCLLTQAPEHSSSHPSGAFLGSPLSSSDLASVSPRASVSQPNQEDGSSSVALPLSCHPFCDPLGWALGRDGGGWLGQWVQEWELHPPSSPAYTLGTLHQNGRVPVFASDGRNVTAAALSTLGNWVWLEELALSPAKLLAAGGWVGRLASWPGWGQPLSVWVPTFLPLWHPQASPPSALLKFLGGREASVQTLVAVWLKDGRKR